jgi:outer-membrane receptor for ferric coprogen and ferric-rhodotorulic acid
MEHRDTLRGRVVDSTGGVVVAAEVTARRGAVTRRAATVADGSFVLSDIVAGEWIVEVNAPGFARLARTVLAGDNQREPLTLALELAALAQSAIVEAENPRSYATPATNTATGLNLSTRETPQSVSVVTRERIDDQQMTTVADALRSTTGISVKPVDRGRNQVSARGFTVSNFQFDGVPTTNGNIGTETARTAIYERIEVVRGATGLLNGTGDPSAAVNLVRKRADSRTPSGMVSGNLASWRQRTGTVDVSTPLNRSGSVRARGVASVSAQNAFIDIENTESRTLYGVLDADLRPNTRLSVGVSDERDERDGVLWALLPYWFADGTRAEWPRDKTTATHWNRWDTTQQTAFLNLEHHFVNQWAVRTTLTGYRQDEESMMLWIEGNPDRTTGLGLEPYPIYYRAQPKQWHVDASASGPLDLFGREHALTVGAMYSHLKDGWDTRDMTGVAPMGNIFTWDGSYPEPAMGPVYVGSGGRTLQSAVYGAAHLQLTDRVKAIVGGRLSNWNRQEEAGAWTPESYEIDHTAVLTPYAGVVVDVGRRLSAYASYTDIFNPQTNRDRSGQYLDPLRGKSYETGLKADFMNGTLTGSVGVFRTQQTNYAVPDPGFFVPGTTTPASRPVDGVHVTGYELELTGALTPAWDMAFGFTQFSGKDADGADVAVDHAREQLKLFSKYRFAGAWSRLSAGGGVNWEGSRPATATNPSTGATERVGQPAYALAEMMARYDIDPHWSLQLNVYNLFDTTYRAGSFWWGAPYTYGEPRKVLLALDYRF